MLQTLIQVALLVALPPLLRGIINKTKAAFAGRVGPPLLQPYYDLIKLLRKDSVFSDITTWVFRAGPVVAAATPLVAGTLIPFGSAAPLVSFSGDLVLFAYLFALSRFFTVLAALDTGSPFEGMGAAREATFSCLAEPALFLGLLALVRASGSLSLATMLGAGLGATWTTSGASLLMVIVSLFIVVLAECSRIPVDDPATHLELTMIHEVMVLDHSGPALGLIEYGAAAKLFVLGALVTRIAVPYGGANVWVNWGLLLVGISALAVVIGVVESVMARLRLIQVPSLLVAANLLSGFGIVLLAR